MKTGSEFGRGLITCLIYFAQHIGRLEDIWLIVADYEKNKRLPEDWKRSLGIYGSFENLVSSRIVMWANGATDHLYEIEVPKDKKYDSIRKKIKRLQKTGLLMGHGFTDRIWTIKDVDSLIKTTNEIALEIDKVIGLNPIAGTWQ